jgi:glycine/sarcosine N-methyltransferase
VRELRDSVSDFYDNLAEEYHLIFEDWHNAISWQGEFLGKLIISKINDLKINDISVLDSSCGIGTQAIGLAKKGYKVTATDLSPASVERARKEAESIGVEINFGVADFRSLENDVSGFFKVVLSADNAISHLLTNQDLLLAAQNMYNKLEEKGIIIVTLKDYDELIIEKPRATQPRILDKGNRIIFQLWDWCEGTNVYTLNHYIMQKINGEWKTKQDKTKYRVLLRREFSKILIDVGFSDIEWYMPEDSGYYQPLLIAKKN